MPIKSSTSTDDECPIKSPTSSSKHEVTFSCCFLTGWLACLFVFPNPHMLKKPRKITISVISKIVILFVIRSENLHAKMFCSYFSQGMVPSTMLGFFKCYFRFLSYPGLLLISFYGPYSLTGKGALT